MSAIVLDFKSYRPRCKYCGHYRDEHTVDPDEEEDTPEPLVRCQRVMEIKNGKVYYICGCAKGAL
jgi:hypothetical protein